MILEDKTYSTFGYTYETASVRKLICYRCDYCNKEFVKAKLRIQKGRSVVSKESCGDKLCMQAKREESQLAKYGVKNAGGIASSLEKAKQTWLKNLGVDAPSKSKLVQEKRAKTWIANCADIAFVPGDRKPSKYWSIKNNRLKYLQWLFDLLGFKETDDFYRLTANDFRKNHVIGLLKYYGMSPVKSLQEFMPDVVWQEWKFASSPRNSWNNKDNRVRYLKWFAERKSIDIDGDGWRNITLDDFRNNRGNGFAQYYGNSVQRAVFDCTKCKLREWEFKTVPKNFWKSKDNCRRYLDWLGNVKGYKNYTDWYNISVYDFKNNRGRQILKLNGWSPGKVMIKYYDEVTWDISKFQECKRGQREVYRIVKEIFPDKVIEWDYWHHGLRFSCTNRPMQLDIFLPQLNIAIEYQDKSHFSSRCDWGGTEGLNSVMVRDAEKRIACKNVGIHLIEITYEEKCETQLVKDKLNQVIQS